MIRHQVFFDTLGSMKEDSASWRSVFAGLSVLRLVDSYLDAEAGAPPVNWAQLHSVRSALEDVAEGDPVRGVLTNALEEVSTKQGVDDSVCLALLAYGRALDYEASWALATDVFATVTKLTRPEKNPRLAVEANIAVGGAARRNGDWEVSARAYSQAAYIADTMGDRQGVLKVQVGIANTYLARGNVPQAQSILDDVVIQSRDQQFDEVQSLALHSRSSIAHLKHEFADAVSLAHEALRLTTIPSDRDRILGDLAAFFTELGLHDTARDANLILTATAQTKWVRWQAALNLMEMASVDGMEDVFNGYVKELKTAPLGPMLKAYFLVFWGEGLSRLGHGDLAQEVLAEAADFTAANQIHALTFRAEEALVASRSKARVEAKTRSYAPVSEEVFAAAHTVSELRKHATASS
ncbi:MAG TPA: hypothetical protein VM166_05580 [Gemmatimonadaceae bacterium]|nr:hypothetical protein [Gemmatimonadaceae bacterium]